MSVDISGGLPFAGGVTPLDAAEGGLAPSPGGLSGTSVARFEEALRGAQSAFDPAQPSVQVAQVQAPGTATDVTPPDAVAPLSQARPTGGADGATRPDPDSAADRAARGLDLDPARDAGPGATILSGLERLRGVFDTQITSVHEKSTGTAMDVVTMMNIQAEVVQYSVLVDVTSKLAGKSTQALDSLMKGQ